MHSYQPQWTNDVDDEPPPPWDFIYRDARDLGAYAALEPLTTWYTYPHLWHLDALGRWRCCSKGSSLDSVRRFAEEPERAVQCRLTDAGAECPDYWVMLEPRHRLMAGHHPFAVTEADSKAFIEFRGALAEFGIRLLDVVIFHEEFRWWSLHELTSGSTEWIFDPPP